MIQDAQNVPAQEYSGKQITQILKEAMKYDEKDIVKHWGVWIEDPDFGDWLTATDSIIFAVTCPRVAAAQLRLVKSFYPHAELSVKEITG